MFYYTLFHALTLICLNTSWSYYSCLGQFDSHFICVPFMPVFNTYVIYFTFIKSVEINNGLNQLLRAKGIRISEARHDKVTLLLVQ